MIRKIVIQVDSSLSENEILKKIISRTNRGDGVFVFRTSTPKIHAYVIKRKAYALDGWLYLHSDGFWRPRLKGAQIYWRKPKLNTSEKLEKVRIT